tara:strand:- start:44 stop:220 length:177 start_codon:yes stop_codon:yes gene_type:complete
MNIELDKRDRPITTSVTMDPSMLDYIDELADSQDRSRSNMVVQIVKYYKAAEKKARRA